MPWCVPCMPCYVVHIVFVGSMTINYTSRLYTKLTGLKSKCERRFVNSISLLGPGLECLKPVSMIRIFVNPLQCYHRTHASLLSCHGTLLLFLVHYSVLYCPNPFSVSIHSLLPFSTSLYLRATPPSPQPPPPKSHSYCLPV